MFLNPIWYKHGMMINIGEFYILILVYMTLTLLQGQW